MQRYELEKLSREELIVHASQLGVPRPRVLTQPELMDEIITRTAKSEREKAKARGWLGRARDLLAQVVEKKLHLPEAARVLRSGPDDRTWPTPPPPLPTVTLAEIYAAQGHLERAIAVLDEVLTREPEHAEAHGLRARFLDQAKARQRRGSESRPESAPASTTAPASAAPPPASIAAPPVAAPPVAAPPVAASAPEPTTPEPSKPEAPKPEAPKPELPKPAPAQPEIHQPEVEAPAPPKPEIEAPTPKPEVEAPATPRSEVEVAAAIAVTEVAGDADEAADDVALDAAADLDATLEEAALPERYDVDEIVALAVDPFTLYFYWEVRATSLARAQARRPHGWLAVRIAGVTASWAGPITRVRDLRADSLYGDRFLRDIEPGSNIRVSVGWQSGDEFEPFAVGLEVTAPHLRASDIVAAEIDQWRPDAASMASALHAPPFDRSHAEARRHADAGGAGTSFSSAASSVSSLAPRRRPAAAPADTGVASWSDSAGGIMSSGSSRRSNMGVEINHEIWRSVGGGSELSRGGASELSLG